MDRAGSITGAKSGESAPKWAENAARTFSVTAASLLVRENWS